MNNFFSLFLAEVKIFSRKHIFNMEICSCCKNDGLQINIYSHDIYPGAYLGNHMIFPPCNTFSQSWKGKFYFTVA